MPIYEYKCGKCHKIIEKIQRIIQDVPSFIVCDACSTPKITVFAKRVISQGTSFVFKGGAPTKRFYK